MKNLLILILFFWSIELKAQFVPNTNTFSLQDVVSGVCTAGTPIDACGTLGTPTSLSECFTVAEYITANLGDFWDATYQGTHDRLSNFRNYGGTPLTCTSLPTILTNAMTGVTTTTAQGDVNLTSHGTGCVVTEMGMVYSTSPNPTTADGKTATPTVATGSYTFDITGLTGGTSYYYRAYATNSYGTAYGVEDYMTQPCSTRPTGLTDYGITASYSDDGGAHSITDQTSACVALDCFVNETCGEISTSFSNVEAFSLTAGQAIYVGHGATNCTTAADGWYIAVTAPSFLLSSSVVIQVVSGVINYVGCPI